MAGTRRPGEHGDKGQDSGTEEATAQDPALVRLKKLGLEVGEPKIFSQECGWVLGTWKRGPQSGGTPRPHGVSVQPLTCMAGTFVTFTIFTSHR